MEWGGIKNGAPLTLIEQEAFHVFITGDKNMQSQQRLECRPFAALVLSAMNWPVIEPHVEEISLTIDAVRPGIVHLVDCGEFVPPGKRTGEYWCAGYLRDR